MFHLHLIPARNDICVKNAWVQARDGGLVLFLPIPIPKKILIFTDTDTDPPSLVQAHFSIAMHCGRKGCALHVCSVNLYCVFLES